MTVENLGQGSLAANGLRVIEPGEGDVFASISDSVFRRLGAYGVELHDNESGSVFATSRDSESSGNRSHCDFDRLAEPAPSDPEGEFKQGPMQKSDSPALVTGTPDDGCFERDASSYDDASATEYDFGIDVDDAFDIDGTANGDLVVTILAGTITGHLDDSADCPGEDTGPVIASFVDVSASNTSDVAFKLSGKGTGDVTGLLIDGSAEGTGGTGAVLDVAGWQDERGTATNFAARGSDDGEMTDI